ncbi:putative mannitol dehydrogenase [Smittium culicis]|uniref:Putative mannitol dehydrogenase n=1 Tax=Smittium culicis TaxID=133412 RepID=A0A1R1XP42_9FUNG|nr:putative mannitol dehydrogenase [Smittium culicis]OMJ23557.1 putative mannitol dehydrogenase [Smittium culicis]
MPSTTSNTIKCWASFGKNEDLKPFEYTPRPLGDHDVDIKIVCCGICGSDLHTIDSDWGATKYPVVVGHEIVGNVIAKGNGVTHLDVGDVVGVGAMVYACNEPDCNACNRGFDPHCPKRVGTYNSKYSDGATSYGGYSERVLVDSNYAFKIPQNIDLAEAAPLMCAGTTVFNPMLTFGFKEGDRVGVVGIGGLGHLAIQYANKLGCIVTAFSQSENKKDQSFRLGAQKFINTNNQHDLEAAKGSLDYLIVTSSSTSNDYEAFGTWVDFTGKIILLALPPKNLVLSPFFFVKNEVFIGGSLIGGIQRVKESLEFASKHNIRPLIEKMPMDKVNEGVNRVRDGKARYRVVLEN